MLRVEDVHVYYGAIHALKGVSFSIGKGELVTLLGANGAGKTTTLKTLSGLLQPQSGRIELEGSSLNGADPHVIVQRGVAHAPEGRKIFPRFTVLENLQIGGYTHPKTSLGSDIERVFELFPRLKERRKQVAGTLSGGEQQMLAIGRALMVRPKLLLLDEPSMGLAPKIVEQILETIQSINQSGVTVLLVEQNAAMALAISHRGYVLETGTVVLHGNAGDLAGNDFVRQAYLGG
ncbi:MAG TPA: ABC transporter ATP-binding protein [Candidatus Binatia bacterium]|nr:ABC transporter ATP-binding protein [Candidatus Binatia bacterium]